MQRAHQTSQKSGWWEKERNFGESIALMHSELSEALEHDRKPEPGTRSGEIFYAASNSGPKPDGTVVELADCVIRIADWCAARGWDLERALLEKLAYNDSRPYKHGGKEY